MIHRCRMRRALLAFHGGELLPRKRIGLATHLEQCPSCAEALRRLEESDRLLAAARPETELLSPEAAGLLCQRALAAAGAQRRPASWLSLAPVGLAVAVFILGAAGPSWVPILDAGQYLNASKIAPMLIPAVHADADRGRGLRGEEISPAAEALPARVLATPGTSSVPPRRSQRRSRHRTAIRPSAVSRRERALPLLRLAERSPRQPLPSASDPQVEMPAGSEELVGDVIPEGESPPAAQMLVMLTAGHVDDLVTVRSAPEETPGYARAAALQPDVNGDLVWTQATVSSEQPELTLVLQTLGDSFGYW